MISGRRTFDIAGGWRNGHPIDAPIFVVTHEAPTEGEWSPQVTFVTDGIEKALELAQAAAGDRDVSTGAADTTQQLLRAGKVDEIEVSLVPCLLGGGVRLLDHVGPTRSTSSRSASSSPTASPTCATGSCADLPAAGHGGPAGRPATPSSSR